MIFNAFFDFLLKLEILILSHMINIYFGFDMQIFKKMKDYIDFKVFIFEFIHHHLNSFIII